MAVVASAWLFRMIARDFLSLIQIKLYPTLSIQQQHEIEVITGIGNFHHFDDTGSHGPGSDNHSARWGRWLCLNNR